MAKIMQNVKDFWGKYQINDFLMGLLLVTLVIFVTLMLVHYVGVFLETMLACFLGDIAPYGVEWGIEFIGGIIIEHIYKKKMCKTIRVIKNRGSTH